MSETTVERYRLDRVLAEVRASNYAGIVLFDPINIRYATGSRNLAVWTLHNPGRYLFVGADATVILFEFSGCFHLSEGLTCIDDIRPAVPWFFFLAGPRTEEKARIWADEIAALVRRHGEGSSHLALDRCDPPGMRRLTALGIEVTEGQPAMEHARAIKCPEEITYLRRALEVADLAVNEIEHRLRPGLTENQLWAQLHEVNIAHGGEWIETRLMASGQRTNPWYQEASDRVVEEGDLVGLDTDLVGPNGYLADYSRTFLCGDGDPDREQRRLYQMAAEQVQFNRGLLKAGITFREFSEKCWRTPDQFVEQRYMDIVHGVGMCDEYPRVPYREDFEDWGYDGAFQENMVVSVESYIGAKGGRQGVKLEQEVLITGAATELLSTYPLDRRLLGH